jgi:DNA repair exonuclease SbcCD ATPase subunit
MSSPGSLPRELRRPWTEYLQELAVTISEDTRSATISNWPRSWEEVRTHQQKNGTQPLAIREREGTMTIEHQILDRYDRYWDGEPEAPEYVGDTCPAIDTGQDMIREIQDLADKLDIQCKELKHQLEEIRDANSTLRSWGHWWKAKALNLRGDLLRAEENFKTLSAKYDELEQRFESLLRQHDDRQLPGLPEGVLLPSQEELDTLREINSADIRGSLARCDGHSVGNPSKETHFTP